MEDHEAFYYLLTWDNGQFQFVKGDTTTINQKINAALTALLMEGYRRIDESKKGI